jgi:hypothetical protein
MSLPFSRTQFFDVFASYNQAVWPAQLGLAAVAIGCLVIVLLRPGRGALAAWGLAFLWAWMAIAYHFVFFTGINGAAWGFGVLSALEAALLVGYAITGALRFQPERDRPTALGALLILYALVGYPIAASFAGHFFPRAPTFGLPCPTTIFTLGLLLLAKRPAPLAVFVVPLLWSAIGSVAAFQLGVVEDYGLLIAGLATGAALVIRRDLVRKPAHAIT